MLLKDLANQSIDCLVVLQVFICIHAAIGRFLRDSEFRRDISNHHHTRTKKHLTPRLLSTLFKQRLEFLVPQRRHFFIRDEFLCNSFRKRRGPLEVLARVVLPEIEGRELSCSDAMLLNMLLLYPSHYQVSIEPCFGHTLEFRWDGGVLRT